MRDLSSLPLLREHWNRRGGGGEALENGDRVGLVLGIVGGGRGEEGKEEPREQE